MAKISDLKPNINTGAINSGIKPTEIKQTPLVSNPQYQSVRPEYTPTPIDTRSLAQKFADTSKSDWQQAGKEWEQMKQNFKDSFADEYRPAEAFEKTA